MVLARNKNNHHVVPFAFKLSASLTDLLAGTALAYSLASLLLPSPPPFPPSLSKAKIKIIIYMWAFQYINRNLKTVVGTRDFQLTVSRFWNSLSADVILTNSFG